MLPFDGRSLVGLLLFTSLFYLRLSDALLFCPRAPFSPPPPLYFHYAHEFPIFTLPLGLFHANVPSPPRSPLYF